MIPPKENDACSVTDHRKWISTNFPAKNKIIVLKKLRELQETQINNLTKLETKYNIILWSFVKQHVAFILIKLYQLYLGIYFCI